MRSGEAGIHILLISSVILISFIIALTLSRSKQLLAKPHSSLKRGFLRGLP